MCHRRIFLRYSSTILRPVRGSFLWRYTNSSDLIVHDLLLTTSTNQSMRDDRKPWVKRYMRNFVNPLLQYTKGSWNWIIQRCTGGIGGIMNCLSCDICNR